MIRIFLLGIVTFSIAIVAPIAASSSISVSPDRAASRLLTRSIFDRLEEGMDHEEIKERKGEQIEEKANFEERRDDIKEIREETAE